MSKPRRHSATCLAILSLWPLAGCATRPPATASAPSHLSRPPTQVFTLSTPLEFIAADPRGKAILERDLPGLMQSRKYLLFEDMSLADIASLSGGRLTTEKLDRVQTDLAQISTPEATQ